MSITKTTHQSSPSPVDSLDFGILCELFDIWDFANIFDTFTCHYLSLFHERQSSVLTFNVHITLEWICSSTINNVHISEQHFAIRVRSFDAIVLRLERWVEMNLIVRIHC